MNIAVGYLKRHSHILFRCFRFATLFAENTPVILKPERKQETGKQKQNKKTGHG